PRAAISIPAINHRLMADKVGYLDVKTLTSGKAAEASRAVRDLVAQGADRLIIDLRNDALGDPQEALKFANLFVENGLLASLQGREFPRRDFNAESPHTIHEGQPVTI